MDYAHDVPLCLIWKNFYESDGGSSAGRSVLVGFIHSNIIQTRVERKWCWKKRLTILMFLPQDSIKLGWIGWFEIAEKKVAAPPHGSTEKDY